MTAADDSAFDSRNDVLKPTPVPFGDDASKFFDGYSVRVGHRYLTLTACDFHVPGQIPVIQCRQLTEQLIGPLVQEFTTRPIVTTAWPTWASLDHGSHDQRLVDAVVATGNVDFTVYGVTHLGADGALYGYVASADVIGVGRFSGNPLKLTAVLADPASVCAAVGQVEAGQFAVACNGKLPDTGES